MIPSTYQMPDKVVNPASYLMEFIKEMLLIFCALLDFIQYHFDNFFLCGLKLI